MPIEFDHWDVGSRERMLRKISEATGVELDNFAILDLERARSLIELELGVSITNAAMQSPAHFIAEMTAIVDEIDGGGAPDWVPENAKVYIDLVNNRAWTEDDGEVAIDTLLGSDPNTENGWSATAYNPAKLDEEGLERDLDTNLPPAFIGTALAKLLSGATFVFRTFGQYESLEFAIMSADGSDAIYTSSSGTDFSVSSYNGPLSVTAVGSLNAMPEEGQTTTNVIAMTLTDDRVDLAVNGSSAETSSLTSSDRPSDNPFVAALVGWQYYMQSIAIYDALPDATGLSELSATE